MKTKTALYFGMGIVLLASCRGVDHNGTIKKGAQKMQIHIVSEAFSEGEIIPKKYTCDGPDMSPPLKWTGVPKGTVSLALIVDDPDAPKGIWVHWVLFNLPSDTRALRDHVAHEKKLPTGGIQGTNDMQNIGYNGPCPPSGTHRYFFKIYALDAMIRLMPGATKQDLLEAMEGHVLAEGQLMGRYSKT